MHQGFSHVFRDAEHGRNNKHDNIGGKYMVPPVTSV